MHLKYTRQIHLSKLDWNLFCGYVKHGFLKKLTKILGECKYMYE